MLALFHAANPSLENRSYAPLEEGQPTYDVPSSNVIVSNSRTLLQDLQRLDNVMAIARNLLTSGERVQNLAAQVGFDREVCAMINLCIKITARGYDGDGTAADEDRWQSVINSFKRLLITCLQFLSNLICKNERLKLMLWVELFDSYSESLNPAPAEALDQKPADSVNTDRWVRDTLDEFKKQHDISPDRKPLPNNRRPSPFRGARSPYFCFVAFQRDKIRAEVKESLGTEPAPEELLEELKRRWEAMTDEQKDAWKRLSEEKFDEYTKSVGRFEYTQPILSWGHISLT